MGEALSNPAGAADVAPHVVARSVGDAIVILDLDSGTYFSLDGAAALIWRSLEAGGSLDDAVDAVIDEYDTDRARAAVDARAFLDEVVAHGLLTLR